MSTSQIIQIADTLHGNIQISFIEKQIISTQAFNRLHNILQNSTVYLTYPSNQTKRFEHSLGVMHLGSQILINSILNAEEQTRTHFFSSLNQEIKSIKNDADFVRMLHLSLGDDFVDLIDDYPNIKIVDPLYQRALPGIIREEDIFPFILLYQAIRLAALLHDVGHPPFSHITESALKDIYKQVNINKFKRDLTKREESFLEATSFYAEDEDADLHEQIGNRIADRLILSLNNKPSNDEEAKKQVFIWFLHRFVMNILCESSKFFEDLHRIIASSIDCDRLDYIVRDMENSGFRSGRLEYDRLISSMQLLMQEGELKGKIVTEYLFCPDIKVLPTLEEYFHRRWLLYKNVIFHHRVVKTDYLLGKAILALSLEYLEKNEEDSKITPQVLPLDISGLWRAIKEVRSNTSYFNALIQWDDAWLLSVLRQQYFEKYYSKKEDITKLQMEELLSNRKYYRSMIKKMDGFFEIDRKVIEHFNINLTAIENTIGQPWKPLLERIKEQIKSYTAEDWHVKAPVDGFILTRLKEIMDTLHPEEPLFKVAVQKATDHVACEKFNAKDCFLVFKRPKTGLEKNFPSVHKDHHPILLDQVSRVHTDLRFYQTGFPTFFVYVMENEKIDHKAFLSMLGEEIAKELVSIFEQKISNNEHGNSV